MFRDSLPFLGPSLDLPSTFPKSISHLLPRDDWALYLKIFSRSRSEIGDGGTIFHPKMRERKVSGTWRVTQTIDRRSTIHSLRKTVALPSHRWFSDWSARSTKKVATEQPQAVPGRPCASNVRVTSRPRQRLARHCGETVARPARLWYHGDPANAVAVAERNLCRPRRCQTSASVGPRAGQERAERRRNRVAAQHQSDT